MRVQAPYENAGVECPKETGEFDKETSCQVCPHFMKCWEAILDVMVFAGSVDVI